MKIIKFILFLFIVVNVSGQSIIQVNGIIKQNDIAAFRSQNLILIDFWATWCGPCIPASKQLSIYQKQLKDEVFMVGISDEDEFTINKFLNKHNIEFAVFNDYQNENIKRFEVMYRPYSVLLDNTGKVLWKGSPSDLSVNKLKKFSSRVKPKVYELNDVFRFKQSIVEQEVKDDQHADLDIFISKINQTTTDEFSIANDRVKFNGNLKFFLSKLLDVSPLYITSELEDGIEFSCEKSIWDSKRKKIKKELLKVLDVKLDVQKKEIYANVFIVENGGLLWDENQINWGNQGNNYLISEDRIQADNMTLNEITNILSNSRNEYYIYQGNNTNQYDWDFHYKFENLMIEELKFQFGVIVLSKQKFKVEFIEIKKSNS